jgi:predicted aldo/keto reductase-like oxidoreductase
VAAGVGLIAMKTVGRGTIEEHADDAELLKHFRERGFNDYQGKMRAVWENEQISNLCAQMPNMAQLEQNVAAALDRTKLTVADHQALERHARNTCTHYCAGCGEICERALGGAVPVSNVMRYLMYSNGYGDTERGRNHFRALPQNVRARLGRMDFTQAEAACPHNLPIGDLMAEATRTLA